MKKKLSMLLAGVLTVALAVSFVGCKKKVTTAPEYLGSYSGTVVTKAGQPAVIAGDKTHEKNPAVLWKEGDVISEAEYYEEGDEIPAKLATGDPAIDGPKQIILWEIGDVYKEAVLYTKDEADEDGRILVHEAGKAKGGELKTATVYYEAGETVPAEYYALGDKYFVTANDAAEKRFVTKGAEAILWQIGDEYEFAHAVLWEAGDDYEFASEVLWQAGDEYEFAPPVLWEDGDIYSEEVAYTAQDIDKYIVTAEDLEDDAFEGYAEDDEIDLAAALVPEDPDYEIALYIIANRTYTATWKLDDSDPADQEIIGTVKTPADIRKLTEEDDEIVGTPTGEFTEVEYLAEGESFLLTDDEEEESFDFSVIVLGEDFDEEVIKVDAFLIEEFEDEDGEIVLNRYVVKEAATYYEEGEEMEALYANVGDVKEDEYVLGEEDEDIIGTEREVIAWEEDEEMEPARIATGDKSEDEIKVPAVLCEEGDELCGTVKIPAEYYPEGTVIEEAVPEETATVVIELKADGKATVKVGSANATDKTYTVDGTKVKIGADEYTINADKNLVDKNGVVYTKASA